MKKKVFNLIIVDESGSMGCIERQTVSGINETLQTIRQCQRENELQEHYVSLLTFNSNKVRTLYMAVPADKAQDIPAALYCPNGCTPLYDAIGNGITELRHVIDVNDQVLVTIITDGEENSSKEYNHHTVTALIDKMKGEGWVFTFIGANIDVKRVSEDLGMNSSISFCFSAEGTEKMYRKEREARRRWASMLEEAEKTGDDTCFRSISQNYFSEDEGK